MKLLLSAFVSGLVFAVGLAIAGMTVPANVIAFLNVTGSWDPALALVMVGGITVYALAYWTTRGASAPPVVGPVDRRLIFGSVLFGLGWGTAGFCPGPALVASATGSLPAVVFSLCMLAGFGVTRKLDAHFQQRSATARENG